ncbi:MAG: hypothetical protein VKJ04_10090 [Vampirovibrionales bacterium]|nr:hypothetical protein [Vampirovibrionales bacterium]
MFSHTAFGQAFLPYGSSLNSSLNSGKATSQHPYSRSTDFFQNAQSIRFTGRRTGNNPEQDVQNAVTTWRRELQNRINGMSDGEIITVGTRSQRSRRKVGDVDIRIPESILALKSRGNGSDWSSLLQSKPLFRLKKENEQFFLEVIKNAEGETSIVPGLRGNQTITTEPDCLWVNHHYQYPSAGFVKLGDTVSIGVKNIPFTPVQIRLKPYALRLNKVA